MDYLVHHGIKGMRWGIRRYQNPDGTLTAAGRKRYNREDSGNESNTSRQPRQRMATGNGALVAYGAAAGIAAGVAGNSHFSAGQVKNWSSSVDSTSKQVRDMTKIKSDERRAQVRMQARQEARGYSDDELKKITKRWENERKYVDLKEGQIEFGQDRVEQILKTTTLVLGAVSTGLTVAMALKTLSGKGGGDSK